MKNRPGSALKTHITVARPTLVILHDVSNFSNEKLNQPFTHCNIIDLRCIEVKISYLHLSYKSVAFM